MDVSVVVALAVSFVALAVSLLALALQIRSHANQERAASQLEPSAIHAKTAVDEMGAFTRSLSESVYQDPSPSFVAGQDPCRPHQ